MTTNLQNEKFRKQVVAYFRTVGSLFIIAGILIAPCAVIHITCFSTKARLNRIEQQHMQAAISYANAATLLSTVDPSTPQARIAKATVEEVRELLLVLSSRRFQLEKGELQLNQQNLHALEAMAANTSLRATWACERAFACKPKP